MRQFDYSCTPSCLKSDEVIGLLLAIREYRGKQGFWEHMKPRVLSGLRDLAKVQSVGASNSIEGIGTTEKRLRGIVLENVSPKNRDEEEIAGYRDVLSLVHEQHDFIPVSPSVILQLHRDMLAHSHLAYGGRWKDTDNEIVAVDEDGNRYVRFRPTPALLTPDAVERLCSTYNLARSEGRCEPLLLAMRFVLDFVSIHPFNDGNGRMSRLLTVLLMERDGYDVGKYISIEHEIERTKGSYYDALAESSAGWESGDNDEEPFVRYMLGVVLGAYRELERRVEAADGLGGGSLTPMQRRVLAVFERRIGKVTKSMVLEECPDISEVTVKRAFAALCQHGFIEKVGSGRTSGYVRSR